jgi:hypothetical protein
VAKSVADTPALEMVSVSNLLTPLLMQLHDSAMPMQYHTKLENAIIALYRHCRNLTASDSMSDKMNLGGRPRHHDGEVKKAAIAVRTAPSIRDALKKAADQSGRSITQEVEARLVASLERDGGTRTPETERLLTEIGGAIAEIEGWTGKRWHKDRKTYGAVLQMMERGPAYKKRVDDPQEDEIVSAAWDKYYNIRAQISPLVDWLNEVGIESVERPGYPRSNRSIFGQRTANKVPNALLMNLSSRWRERAQLDDSNFPETIKSAALAIIGQLEALDEQSEKALEDWREAQRPFIAAEQDGRDLYKSRMRESAERAKQEGGNFDWADIVP